jgi:hypothetical protein
MGDKTGPSMILRCSKAKLLADQVCRDAQSWINESGERAQSQFYLELIRELLVAYQGIAFSLVKVKKKTRGLHQQAGHAVLHLHHLLDYKASMTKGAAPVADLGRCHVALGQEIATQAIGDLAGIDSVVLLFAAAIEDEDRFLAAHPPGPWSAASRTTRVSAGCLFGRTSPRSAKLVGS